MSAHIRLHVEQRHGIGDAQVLYGGSVTAANAASLLAQPDTLAGVKTDDRIAVYQAMIAAQSDNLHYHGLLAGAYPSARAASLEPVEALRSAMG